MPKLWILPGLLGLSLLLAACGSKAPVAPAKAEAISCTAAYRANVTVGMEREQTLIFASTDSEQTIAFTDLSFHAAYRAGESDNERNLRIWVTGPTGSTTYHSTLFQLPLDSGPQNQFSGGHGFTGLNYSYRPDNTAELQYWCEAQ